MSARGGPAGEPVLAALLHAAHHAEAQAEALRARGRHLELAVATARWHSAGARAFRAAVHDRTLAMAGCAAQLDDLADELRRHARRCAAAIG